MGRNVCAHRPTLPQGKVRPSDARDRDPMCGYACYGEGVEDAICMFIKVDFTGEAQAPDVTTLCNFRKLMPTELLWTPR